MNKKLAMQIVRAVEKSRLLLWLDIPSALNVSSLLRLGDDTQLHTPHSVVLLSMRDRSVAETST
jgi:hypothetical protein